MARLGWKAALLAVGSVAYAQQSTMSKKADGSTSSPSMTATPTYSLGTALVNGTSVTYSVPYTPPASVDNGPNLLPNILNASAKDAQTLCPGYKASDVRKTEFGLTATLSLAGQACNVYGTDVDFLALTIDYQTAHRVRVYIEPKYIDSSNYSQYILSPELVYLPEQGHVMPATQDIDLQVVWSNDPTFSFTVLRKSTGDVVFDTRGSVLVYENQFIEFVTQMPQDYNIYGMGERIHGLRLGNNFTTTFYAADAGDPIDRNIYGNHPVYLDTRYYEVDNSTGERKYISTANATAGGHYESYSHGVYNRNSHGMEALLLPSNITWRALGGTIDLYFMDGPTPNDVFGQYTVGAVGTPAMQQYWTFGFHQCRWGYKNWSEDEDVVKNYRKFDIPLETMWNGWS